MKTVKFIMIIGLLTMVSAVYAQNEGNSQRERKHQREHHQRGPAALDLTEEQQTKASELRLNMQKAALPIKNKLGENRAKMRTLTTVDNPDMKAINKLIDENAGLRAQLAKFRAANHQEFRKILTEEQRVKFDSRTPRKFIKRRMRRGERQQHGQQGQQRQFKGQLE